LSLDRCVTAETCHDGSSENKTRQAALKTFTVRFAGVFSNHASLSPKYETRLTETGFLFCGRKWRSVDRADIQGRLDFVLVVGRDIDAPDNDKIAFIADRREIESVPLDLVNTGFPLTLGARK